MPFTTDTIVRFTTVPTANKLAVAIAENMPRSRRLTVAVGRVLVEVEVDYQNDRATAYALDDDGEATVDNEIATIPFDMDVNIDSRDGEAIDAVCDAVVDFWVTVDA